MVTNITNLSRSGLSDWLLQRLSAVVIAAYIVWLTSVFICYPHMDFIQWNSLFEKEWVKLFTFVSLLAIAIHAWIGLWTIATDYIKSMFIRLAFQLVCIFLLFVYVLWGIQILWDL